MVAAADGAGARQHCHAGQGGGAAEPGPDAAALPEEQVAEYQDPGQRGEPPAATA